MLGRHDVDAPDDRPIGDRLVDPPVVGVGEHGVDPTAVDVGQRRAARHPVPGRARQQRRPGRSVRIGRVDEDVDQRAGGHPPQHRQVDVGGARRRGGRTVDRLEEQVDGAAVDDHAPAHALLAQAGHHGAGGEGTGRRGRHHVLVDVVVGVTGGRGPARRPNLPHQRRDHTHHHHDQQRQDPRHRRTVVRAGHPPTEPPDGGMADRG